MAHRSNRGIAPHIQTSVLDWGQQLLSFRSLLTHGTVSAQPTVAETRHATELVYR